MLSKNCKKLTIKRQVIKPKESAIGKVFMQLYNYAKAGGRIPQNVILVKNTNERKVTSNKNNKLVLYKKKMVSQRMLDKFYISNLIKQGMMTGLFDYTFKYSVVINGKNYCCAGEIELKRDKTEELRPSQVAYKQLLDNVHCPNLVTHDPEEALKFLINTVKGETNG